MYVDHTHSTAHAFRNHDKFREEEEKVSLNISCIEEEKTFIYQYFKVTFIANRLYSQSKK